MKTMQTNLTDWLQKAVFLMLRTVVLVRFGKEKLKMIPKGEEWMKMEKISDTDKIQHRDLGIKLKVFGVQYLLANTFQTHS